MDVLNLEAMLMPLLVDEDDMMKVSVVIYMYLYCQGS